MSITIKRGDIYLADLNPTTGCEQGGIRPVLIIQNDIGNMFSPTTIVAAVTAKQSKKELPVHFALSNHMLKADSVLLLEQIRTIDKSRLKSYLGSVSRKDMGNIDKLLKISVGLMSEENTRKKSKCRYIY